MIDIGLADVAGAAAFLTPDEFGRFKARDAPLHRARLDADGRGEGLFGRMGLASCVHQ
jgi:hypothetical protein